MTDLSPSPLACSELYNSCDPDVFSFRSTDELEAIEPPIGQERASRAVEFAIRVEAGEYNLYAIGPPGIGKRALVWELIAREAATSTIPNDWCYANNFSDPQRPHALRLPAGRGCALSRDMDRLVEELHAALSAASENWGYQSSVEEV